MQCQTCQYELPAGVTFCPNCGTPVPAGSSPNQGIPPTVVASPFAPPPSPGLYGGPANYGESAPPQPNQYGMPQQGYDPTIPSYGAPPQSYGAPQQGAYGAPSPMPYGAPQQASAPYVPPPQYGQPQPKKSNGCVIAVVVVLVVVLLIVGGVVAAGYILVNKGSSALATVGTGLQATVTSDEATANSELTPTTGSTSGLPDPSQIDSTARANITSVQPSNGMDTNFQPTHPTTSFNVGDTVDITFTLAGNQGFATAKIYVDGQFLAQPDTPLSIDSGDTNGAFTYSTHTAGQYVAALYWCTESDCSDAALAQVTTFSVS